MTNKFTSKVTVAQEIYPRLYAEVGALSARARAARILLLAEQALMGVSAPSTVSNSAENVNNTVSAPLTGAGSGAEAGRNPALARPGVARVMRGLRDLGE